MTATDPQIPRARDRVFQFRYTVFNVAARLDDKRIEVRAGVRTSAAPLDRIQHLHVHRDAGRGVDELLLSYAAPGGRLKRIRVFSDPGQSGFDHLVDALLAARPETDFRHLDRQEAWRMTGSRELDGVVLPLMMIAAILGLAVFFAPRIMHGFDHGEPTPITVDRLARDGAPDTRHLRVEGRMAIEQMMRAETDETARTVTAWVPIVGPDWTPKAPVPAMLELRNKTEAAILEIAERSSFDGLLRDIAWEGLDDRHRQRFVQQGLVVAAGVPLVEYGASPRDDLLIAISVLGLLTAMMVGIVWGLRRRMQAAAKGEERVPLNRPRGPEADGID